MCVKHSQNGQIAFTRVNTRAAVATSPNSANPMCWRASGPVGAFNCLLFGEFLGFFVKIINSKSTSCCYRFLDVFRKEIKNGRAEVGTEFWQSIGAPRLDNYWCTRMVSGLDWLVIVGTSLVIWIWIYFLYYYICSYIYKHYLHVMAHKEITNLYFQLCFFIYEWMYKQ